jgi:hypothetical protein
MRIARRQKPEQQAYNAAPNSNAAAKQSGEHLLKTGPTRRNTLTLHSRNAT